MNNSLVYFSACGPTDKALASGASDDSSILSRRRDIERTEFLVVVLPQ